MVCVVTKVEKEKGQKKRIHLSVDPRRINKGLNKDNVLPGMVCLCVVACVCACVWECGRGVCARASVWPCPPLEVVER